MAYYMTTVTLNYHDYLQYLREDFRYAMPVIQNAVNRNIEVLKGLYKLKWFARFLKSEEIKGREYFVENAMQDIKRDFERFNEISNAPVKPVTVTLDSRDYERLVKKRYNLSHVQRGYFLEN